MNACCFSRSAGARSFLRNNMLLQNSYLPCCVVEKSRCHVCRGFACFWVFVCWLTPIPLTVLCVSTCSDGLLDFHTAACSVLLRFDLLAKKVPGRAPYSQHIIIHIWTKLNRNKTEQRSYSRPKIANKQINQLD